MNTDIGATGVGQGNGDLGKGNGNENDGRELPLVPFGELKGNLYIIPYQQRGYRWTSANVEELLGDLKDFIENTSGKKRIYCLQPLALVAEGGNTYRVLDGQQRLTTLYLLYRYLYGEAPYRLRYERDKDDGEGMSRAEFLEHVAEAGDAESEENIDFHYIRNAYKHIGKVFGKWGRQACGNDNERDVQAHIETYAEAFRSLLEADGNGAKSLQVIEYKVEAARQHETFRNLNSGKIHLTNTELIKALMLNRASGLPPREREEAAVLLEQMEEQMQEDRFRYMFDTGELREGQARMDFIFNLVAGCRQKDCETDARWAFRNYFGNPEHGTLSEKWRQVRHTYLRLRDMYEDIYTYHYIGLLTYNAKDNTLNNTRRLLGMSRGCRHSDFVKRLKAEIKAILTRKHNSIGDYTYLDDPKDLRLLFVMHNVETLLGKYALLHENEKLNLRAGFERFPFELLHKQHWDIEHIASQTESDFKRPEDRTSWLESIKADLGAKYPSAAVGEMEKRYLKTKRKEDFDPLYHAIMTRCEADIADAIKDHAEDGKDKMQIGNLTLLDRHTNRSYHNALFARKRRYVIVANGLTDTEDEDEAKIEKVYVPPCTAAVFTKAYNKGGDLTLNAWTQADADAYTKDMEQKLREYYK